MVEFNKITSYDLDKLAKTIPNLRSLTYTELVTLVNEKDLVPGAKYRITDYNTTVNLDEGSYSVAGKQFDVIVEAVEKGVLSSDAMAMPNDDVSSFPDNDLSKWKLKYSLDNYEQYKFDWSKPDIIKINNTEEEWYLVSNSTIETNGETYYCWLGDTEEVYTLHKNPGYSTDVYRLVDGTMTLDLEYFITSFPEGRGTIYEMIDEFDNKANYDFKNILVDEHYTFGDTTDLSLNGITKNNTFGDVSYANYTTKDISGCTVNGVDNVINTLGANISISGNYNTINGTDVRNVKITNTNNWTYTSDIDLRTDTTTAMLVDNGIVHFEEFDLREITFLLKGTKSAASGTLTAAELEYVKKATKILAVVNELDQEVTYIFTRGGLNTAKTILYFNRFYVQDGTTINVRVITIDLSTGAWTIDAVSNTAL